MISDISTNVKYSCRYMGIFPKNIKQYLKNQYVPLVVYQLRKYLLRHVITGLQSTKLDIYA